MAERYAISGSKEATAYLQHEVLGPHIKRCTGLVNQIENRTIQDIFGYPNNLKFRSSITLFDHVAPGEIALRTALERYFAGKPDSITLARL